MSFYSKMSEENQSTHFLKELLDEEKISVDEFILSKSLPCDVLDELFESEPNTRLPKLKHIIGSGKLIL